MFPKIPDERRGRETWKSEGREVASFPGVPVGEIKGTVLGTKTRREEEKVNSRWERITYAGERSMKSDKGDFALERLVLSVTWLLKPARRTSAAIKPLGISRPRLTSVKYSLSVIQIQGVHDTLDSLSE